MTAESDSTVDFLFAFTGRERDAESDLQYNRARYYHAATGNWISLDPIGFNAGDANLYRYVGNGPAGASDPSGLQVSFPGTFVVQSNGSAAKPYPKAPATGETTRIFAKGFACTKADVQNIEVTNYSHIIFTVRWDYTLEDTIEPVDTRSDFERELDDFHDMLEGAAATHVFGQHRSDAPSVSISPIQDCDGSLRMRIKIRHTADVVVTRKEHPLYGRVVSSYAPNAGPMGFDDIVQHEWDHARTYIDGLFDELVKIAPLMEKRYESQAEYRRVARQLKINIGILFKEAKLHSDRFDTREPYLGHYEKYPFSPSTNVLHNIAP